MSWQIITEQQRFTELLTGWASAKTLALRYRVYAG